MTNVIEEDEELKKPAELSRINEKIAKVLSEKEALLYELYKIKESYELEVELDGYEQKLVQLDFELSEYLEEKNRILVYLLFRLPLPWLPTSKE